MMPPRISVVMGAYNNVDTLSTALDSVLSQDGVNLEFVVIDDGSTDGTAALLDKAAQGDPRLRIVHKPNGGLTRALADGCALARAEFVARIDAGDCMLASRLRRQQEALDRHPETVLVSCRTEVCGPEWEVLYVARGGDGWEEGGDVLPDRPGANLKAGPTHHGSVMFRRDAYLAAGGYRWPFYYGQDWDLWYRLAERGAFALIPEVLYRARLFPDGISACHRVRQEQLGRLSLEAFRLRRQGLPEEQCLRQAAAIRPGRPSAPAWRSKGEGAHLIGELLRTRGDTRCRPYFLQALRSNPFRLNSWVRLLQSFAGGGS